MSEREGRRKWGNEKSGKRRGRKPRVPWESDSESGRIDRGQRRPRQRLAFDSEEDYWQR